MNPRTLRLGAALAAALAAAGASAYVRTTSTQGACFYWAQREVHFRINAARTASSVSCGDPALVGDAAAIQAVRSGFQTWTGAAQDCTDLRLVDGGLSDSRNVGFDQRSGAQNENLVVFRSGWCSQAAPQGYDDPCWDVDPFATPGAIGETCANKYNCFEDPQPADRATIAITTVTHNPNTGQIHDADIEFAAWNGNNFGQALEPSPSTPAPNGWYYTCGTDAPRCGLYGQEGCTYVDLQSNATHEVGHFIGLAHPCSLTAHDCTSLDRPLVMYPAAMPGDTSKRVLTADDRAGLCAIYPLGAATSTCGVRKSGGGGGCASGGAGGILSALLALAALARGRRRLGAPRA